MDKEKAMGAREKGLIIALVVAIAAAVAGFALFFTNQVPQTAAAKVNDMYLDEADVADYISQYRYSYSLTDDATWASYLLSQNSNPSSYRMTAINQLALNALVIAKAEELGVSPTEDEITAQLDTMKNSLAFGDDQIWNETLDQMGTTEAQLRNQAKANLATQAVYKAAVEVPEATDEQALQFAQENLGGVEVAHSYRIVFTGDDAQERAQECYERIQKAKKDINADVFSGFALSYSDDETVQDDGGSYGWTQLTDSEDNDTYAERVTGLEDGAYTTPQPIEENGESTFQIIFRDESYSFPAADKMSSFKLSKVSSTVKSYIVGLASNNLWSNQCSAYLSQLLASAQITYYPTPANAAYNVDMNLASTTSTESSDSTESAE